MSPRVPVVLQMNSVECGAACLAMILGYFGRKTRLEECRSKCDPGRDGVTARVIAEAARQFGLRATAFAVNPGDIMQMSTPAALFWENNHFVVLERWSKERVDIVDPGWGRRQLSLSEFEEKFSGVMLRFEAGPEFDTRAPRRNSLLWTSVQRLMRTPGTGSVLARILTASVVLQALGFALPLFTKLVVDRALPLRAVSELNMLCGAAFVAALTTATMAYVRSLLLIRLETQVDSHLMLEFFRHLLSLPFRFFQQRSSGDLLMRLGSNAAIREALASYTTSSVVDGVLVIVFLAALWFAAPLFALAALAIALAEVAILVGSAKRLRCLLDGDLTCQAASQSCLVESLIGISTLKASGAERGTFDRWSRLLAKQVDAAAQRNRYTAGIEAAMTMVRTFSPLFLLWLGATFVLNGAMSLGTMLAITALAAAFLQPVASLVMSGQRLQLAAANLERIADVLNAEPEQRGERPKKTTRLSGHIEIRNVSFRYDAHSPKVLDDISLHIQPGQKIAFVGRTGSGKSTLAKLLLGLYTPTEGEILYDGVPLADLDLESLRSQWGTVLQDCFLFSSSLRDNISFHKRDMPASVLAEAARIAEIDSEIESMPMRYETRIDEGGASLSGGQRQRIAIARAVASGPRMLLLDEATSNLDVVTEAAIDRNLDRLSCTRVVIAHRLSTIENADSIVVVDRGRVVEQGTHRELLAINGHYASLVAAQREGSDQREQTIPCLG